MYETIQEVNHTLYQKNEELPPNHVSKDYEEALDMTLNDAYRLHQGNEGQASPQISKGCDMTLNDAYDYASTQVTSKD